MPPRIGVIDLWKSLRITTAVQREDGARIPSVAFRSTARRGPDARHLRRYVTVTRPDLLLSISEDGGDRGQPVVDLGHGTRTIKAHLSRTELALNKPLF